MMKSAFSLLGRALAGSLIFVSLSLTDASAQVDPAFTQVEVVRNLDIPTAMAFAPDGRIFVCEKDGNLRVIKNGQLLVTNFLSVPVNSEGERGLIGVAVDPNFATNQYIYIYYTVGNVSPIVHRVSRFRASFSNPDVAEAGSETIILNNIPSPGGNHNGGALHFGVDGKLYIAIGDGVNSANSQSLSTLLGKVLRINSDGSIPTDNPFYATATGVYRAIYALGLRNPYTFSIDFVTQRMFINDVGQDTWEEVNQGARGANYGWPTCEGVCNNPAFTNPIYAYAHAGGSAAVTGGVFYRGAAYPAEYQGSYFFADYAKAFIRRLNMSNQPIDFLNNAETPIDLDVNPVDGKLYYLSIFSGKIFRFDYAGTANQPPVAQISANPLTGVAPLTVAFSAAGSSDPEGGPLTYSWNFGDGSANASGLTTTKVYSSAGSFTATVTVTDNQGRSASKSVTISVSSPTNTPPVATIVTPAAAATFAAGDTINYSGTGTDAQDGTLAASKFSWNIIFHHDSHIHPFLGPLNGVTNGSFSIPRIGETDPDVFYRIHLTVSDSQGATHEVTRDINPRKANLTVRANVDGLMVNIDGQPQTSPYGSLAVVGLQRNIGVISPQTFGGKTYEFVNWSDGGTQTHDVIIPDGTITYTATFREVAPPVATFPVSLEGAVPEEKTANVVVPSIPAGSMAATLLLNVYDPDFATEGELFINGQGPVALFGAQGVTANDQQTLNLTFSTPTGWWQAGNNALRFRHTATNGYRVNAASVQFTGADITPAAITNGAPTGTLPAGTTSTTLLVTTNEAATCKYGTTAGVAFDAIVNTFATTGGVSHSQPISGLTDGATRTFSVRCKDSAGNANPSDYVINFSVARPSADAQPPTVSLSAPAAGATVSGTVTLSANASDNVGVTGVQFKVDGNNVGSEDTTSPYSVALDSRTLSNGAHTLTAVARDAAGNSQVSTGVSIQVNNPVAGTAVYLEAESGTVTSPMVKANNAAASGGVYVYSSTGQSGLVSLTVSVPTAGNYYFWGRTLSANGSSDSFYVSVDAGAEDIWDTAQNLWSPNWQWTRVTGRAANGGSASVGNTNPRVFNLAAGTHTIKFRGREPGTLLDKIFVTSSATQTPSDVVPPPVCEDADQDGYPSSMCGGSDCNDRSSAIRPGATEICGNGVDEDCSGADLACLPTSNQCANGPIPSSGCLCGGGMRFDNFCCNNSWHSYDACAGTTTTAAPVLATFATVAPTQSCANGPIPSSGCVCSGGMRHDSFCCNGNWQSYACQ